MRYVLSAAVAILGFTISGPAHAAILDAYCADDGDGAVTMNSITYTYQGDDEVSISVQETQHWSPAHLEGWIKTNTTSTKNVWILKEVENDTGFTWDGYTLNVYRHDPFDITGTSQSTGWLPTVSPVNAAAGSYFDSHGVEWAYLGVVDYAPIDPSYNIEVGESGDFGVKISFAGSSDPADLLTFQVEQIPVPEPAALVLLSAGGLFLRRRR